MKKWLLVGGPLRGVPWWSVWEPPRLVPRQSLWVGRRRQRRRLDIRVSIRPRKVSGSGRADSKSLTRTHARCPLKDNVAKVPTACLSRAVLGAVDELWLLAETSHRGIRAAELGHTLFHHRVDTCLLIIGYHVSDYDSLHALCVSCQNSTPRGYGDKNPARHSLWRSVWSRDSSHTDRPVRKGTARDAPDWKVGPRGRAVVNLQLSLFWV